ncbi:hypothetical protein Tco_1155808 [Tanacetum coccineum]
MVAKGDASSYVQAVKGIKVRRRFGMNTHTRVMRVMLNPEDFLLCFWGSEGIRFLNNLKIDTKSKAIINFMGLGFSNHQATMLFVLMKRRSGWKLRLPWRDSEWCNSSFITLIPKVPNASMVKEFRPISLIGSLYKIIAKVLANRMVMVLNDLVNEIQSAFVADRQILDVRWDFIDDILRRFGFGEKWCMWIQSCLHSSRGSVLVNGSPTKGFQFFTKDGDGYIMSRIQSWSDVIESMRSRLSRWKLKTLSIGGRLTLLKSVLGAIPIYQMSLYKVPMKVLQNMETIRSRFFNGAYLYFKNKLVDGICLGLQKIQWPRGGQVYSPLYSAYV